MNRQILSLLKLKHCIGVIAVTIFWSTTASATLVPFNITISDSFSINPLYTGIATIDSDTQVLLPGNANTLGHRYNLSYDIQSTQGAQIYSGIGTLTLGVLLDAYVSLAGFKDYMTEGPEPVIDPAPAGWVWHDANFDISTLRSLSANELSSASPRTWIKVEQVPEPSILLLTFTGLAGLMFVRRKA
jgi:hypothetical protein